MNRKILIVSLLIIAGALILMGGSYAYFTAMATSNKQTVQSGTLELTYVTGKDIVLENAFPGEETEAGIHQFSIENTGTVVTDYNISLVDIVLTKNGTAITSSNLCFALYLADSEYVEDSLVKKGSFSVASGYLVGDKELVAKTGMHLKPKEKQNYVLKIWLQETGTLQNEDADIELMMKVQVDTMERQEAENNSVLRKRDHYDSTENFYQYSDSITKIVFQNKISPITEKVAEWDVSEDNSGNCMAYLISNKEPTNTTYTLYIQGNNTIYLSDGLGLFYQFTKLEAIEGMQYLDTSQVKSMYRMFYGCSQLKTLDISKFDTSMVTNMSYMFRECSSLTSLVLSHFNTQHVTDMYGMFYGCSQLKTLDISKFDTSLVTDMSYMFGNCTNLASLDLSSFNTSRVTNMDSMFYGCSQLVSLDLNHFDTDQVVNMSRMFARCYTLDHLDFRNASFNNVAIHNDMFYSVLDTIQVIVKDDTAKTWIQNRLLENSITGTVIISS